MGAVPGLQDRSSRSWGVKDELAVKLQGCRYVGVPLPPTAHHQAESSHSTLLRRTYCQLHSFSHAKAHVLDELRQRPDWQEALWIHILT